MAGKKRISVMAFGLYWRGLVDLWEYRWIGNGKKLMTTTNERGFLSRIAIPSFSFRSVCYLWSAARVSIQRACVAPCPLTVKSIRAFRASFSIGFQFSYRCVRTDFFFFLAFSFVFLRVRFVCTRLLLVKKTTPAV